MQRERRLTTTPQFSSVHENGRGWANRYLVLRTIPNHLDKSRFGFLTGKRIGNSVVRNRVKRRLREAVRLASVKEGWDVVFIARRGSADANYKQLDQAVGDLLKRSGLLFTQATISSKSSGTPNQFPARAGKVDGQGNIFLQNSHLEAEA